MSNKTIKTKLLFDKEYINSFLDSNFEVKYSILKILEQINIKNKQSIILNNKNIIKETTSFMELKHILNKHVSISSIILTFNEERCIKRCITSILEFSDEVIIIDSQSTDNTIKYINELNSDKIKIYTIKWINDFSFARNYGIKKATFDWIFFIDADEYIDPNYDVTLIRKTLSFLSLILDTSKMIVCPSIYDESSDRILTTVTRILPNNQNIYYFGMIHEELRCKNNDDIPLIINLNIKINHDGYLPEIIKSKDKLNRNLKILSQMIQIEPDNTRWIYLYCRESFYLCSIPKNLTEIENILLSNILINSHNSFKFDNIRIHKYIYEMLDLLCKIKISQKKFDDIKDITLIMERLNSSNSDIVYYNYFAKIMKLKQENAKLLSSIVKYRKSHFEIQNDVINCNGYHIDFLIAILLFENMEYKSSNIYFNFLNNKLHDESFKEIINFYLNMLQNFK